MKPTYSINPEIYRLGRPEYGNEIYSYIQTLLNGDSKAWDCACGTGQVSEKLSEFIDQVYATDIDLKQLECAKKKNSITYQEAGELVPFIGSNSIDLVTVGTGIHWMNQKTFYQEVDRVLKAGGVLAIWGYTGIDLHEDINEVVKEIVSTHFMPYYPENINIAFNGYKEIHLPFQEVECPNFKVKYTWDFFQLKKYFLSFSAMQLYKKVNGDDGFKLFEDQLLEAWGGDRYLKKELTWELITKISIK